MTSRTTAVLVAMTLLGTTLAGCTLISGPDQRPPVPASESPSSSSRSTEDAAASIADVPGATARIGRAYNGTTPFLTINVTLDDTFAAGVPASRIPEYDAAFLDHVLRQAWSQDQDSPESYVTIGVSGAGRTPEGLTTALATLGIAAIPYAGDSLSLKGEDLTARYGTWPGAVPALPAELGGAGEATPSP